ncbi:MAG: diguanylate cyclase [Candidatus Cloacimonetes bacterium]|nr:diguanylate cyclase [Candidatus Cloacimonadota bacterium]
MKKYIILFLFAVIIVKVAALTRLDFLKQQLETASGLQEIVILDELQKAYWKIYPQASLEYGIQALKSSTNLKNELQKGKQLNNIAISYKHLEDYEKAIEYMTLCLRQVKKINDIELQINALYYLASFENALARNVKAFEYALEALDLSKKSKNHPGLAKCHFIIAEIYFDLNDLKGAYENYLISLAEHENFDDKSSYALTNEKLGEIDLYNKNYNYAEDHFYTASENYEAINDLESLVRTYQALGRIYKESGEKEKALEYVEKYAETNEQLNQRIIKNKLLHNYEYYNVIGSEDKALEYYKLYTAHLDSLKTEIKQKQVDELISDIEYKHEKEKAKTTEKILEVERTAEEKLEEKQQKIEKLVNETQYIEKIAKLENDKIIKQIEAMQNERNLKEVELKRQQKINKITIYIAIIIGVFIVIIGFIAYSRYKLQEKYTSEMEKIAKTDLLTQLPNRRAVLDQINYEVNRFLRNNEPFTIVISDIDDFKNINDSYGHDVGDKVLIALAKLIKDSIRKQDICARWGGEEFLFLLPGTDAKGGLTISEKIRKKIEKEKIKHGENLLTFTMTFGVSTYTKGSTVDECITRADKALYQGKKTGKNRVECFKQTPVKSKRSK